jgi:ethanolamine utilization protein EutN
MFVGKIIGTVVATRKSEALIGNKLMVVKPVETFSGQDFSLIAVDTVGAGIGETVLVVTGSSARLAVAAANAPVDAAIVGIVDSMDTQR